MYYDPSWQNTLDELSTIYYYGVGERFAKVLQKKLMPPPNFIWKCYNPPFTDILIKNLHYKPNKSGSFE